MRLSSELLSKLSTALLRLYSVASPEELPLEFLRITQGLLDCEQLAYNEFSPNHLSTIHEPFFETDLNNAFLAHINQHPSINYVKQTKTTSAVKISDFLTSQEWQRTDLYNEFFRKIRIKHQIAFMFRATGFEIGFAANRERRDFTETDRVIVSMLAEHLSQAVHNVNALAKAQARLNQVSDATGAGGTIIIDSEGGIVFCSRNAAECISRFFGAPVGIRLPDDLNRWVRELIDKPMFESLASGALHPLNIDGKKSRLRIRFMPNHFLNEHTLVIEEEMKELPFSAFKKFGLTHREVEVLNWVTQGKTNPEIAIILGISVKTVGHHVEHIMTKLGVERRGGAALWALQTLRAFQTQDTLIR